MVGVIEFAHEQMRDALHPGSWAVDATAGNGHDTCILAEAVGQDGHVWAFDVQPEAIAATHRRLEAHELSARVTLLEQGHQQMKEALPPEAADRVRGVMFNLGYLPGSDKECITRPATTLPALEASTSFLLEGGVLTIVCYPGHAGGTEETKAVQAWAADLEQERFRVLSYRFTNQRNDPPQLLIVERRPAGQ